MAECSTKIRKITFDVDDEQITKVTVEIDFWGDCPIQLKRVYEKTFPARIPCNELLEKEVPKYLTW